MFMGFEDDVDESLVEKVGGARAGLDLDRGGIVASQKEEKKGKRKKRAVAKMSETQQKQKNLAPVSERTTAQPEIIASDFAPPGFGGALQPSEERNYLQLKEEEQQGTRTRRASIAMEPYESLGSNMSLELKDEQIFPKVLESMEDEKVEDKAARAAERAEKRSERRRRVMGYIKDILRNVSVLIDLEGFLSVGS